MNFNEIYTRFWKPVFMGNIYVKIPKNLYSLYNNKSHIVYDIVKDKTLGTIQNYHSVCKEIKFIKNNIDELVTSYEDFKNYTEPNGFDDRTKENKFLRLAYSVYDRMKDVNEVEIITHNDTIKCKLPYVRRNGKCAYYWNVIV